MFRILVVVLLTLLMFVCSAPQGCLRTEPWSAVYPADQDMIPHDITRVPGGYLVVGEAVNRETTERNILLMKVSHNGNLLWKQTFLNEGNETAFAVTRRKTGGLLLTGVSTTFPDEESDLFLLTANATGQVEWMQTYRGDEHDRGADVIETHDGGFVAIGSSRSYQEDNNEGLWVLKTDANGQLIWSKIYREGVWSRGVRILETRNHSLVTLGASGFDAHNNSVFLLRLDETGREIWRRSYWETGCSNAVDMARLGDGFVIVARRYDEFEEHEDICLLATDRYGNEKWVQYYDLQGGDDFPRALSVSYDEESFMVSGATTLTGDWRDRRLFLTKVTFTGELLWNRIYGGVPSEAYTSMAISPKSALIAGTQTTNVGTELWLLSVNEQGYAPGYDDYH